MEGRGRLCSIDCMARSTFLRHFTAVLTATLVTASVCSAAESSREIQITGKYLYLPVSGGVRAKVVKVTDGEQEVCSLPVELADGVPEWWASIDVSAYKGKSIRVSVTDGLASGSRFLEGIEQGDQPIKHRDGLYGESLRPLFHVTASRGWINDPNGPIFHNGTYHLFFQWDPAGVRGNTKYWGHVTSPDLVNWTEHDAAISPDRHGPVWSGSAVFDRKNTSGLGTADRPPLALIYTAAGNPFTQCLVYSTDGGKTFNRYAKNPIVPNIHSDNRDPRVIWHEPTQKWVMVVWVKNPTNDGRGLDTIQFLTSPNLLEWTKASEIDGYFECPDLIDMGNGKWVLTAAAATYQVGTFDGKTFHPSTRIESSSATGVFYAPQTFSDAPQGRVLQVGWLRGDIPGMPFNQCLSVVHELSLVETPAGLRLSREPVRELATLRTQSMKLSGKEFARGEHFLGEAETEGVEVRMEFAPAERGRVELNVRGVEIVYDRERQEIEVAGVRTRAELRRGGKQRLTVLVDRTAVEVFASDGLTYVPVIAFPDKAKRGVYLRTNTPQTFDVLEVHSLKSMWPGAKSAK